MRGHPAALGDTRTSPNGYHYTRTENGWELTGRLVAAKKLGRPLAQNERIRYVDGDRTNLNPDNIEVYVVTKNVNRRRAQIEARIEELQSELRDLT